MPELPAAFFAGYGVGVSRPLLRLHRIVGNLGVLNSEWSEMAADTPHHPANLRSMLAAWDEQLRGWLDRIEEHLQADLADELPPSCRGVNPARNWTVE